MLSEEHAPIGSQQNHRIAKQTNDNKKKKPRPGHIQQTPGSKSNKKIKNKKAGGFSQRFGGNDL